ncbi:MAG: plastocyanin/azurin family copper-binding protein [Gammaproteobacteria bacterium]
MITFMRPGDRVVFRQMTGHDTETIEGLIPGGATPWKSALGEEGFSVTLDVPGAYVFKCNPHVSTGMVGAIVVGDTPPQNMDAIQDSPLNKGMIGRAIRKLGEALDAR